jgi:hypothetical protein
MTPGKEKVEWQPTADTTTGRFFEAGHLLDIAELRTRNCVAEIEDVGDDQDKAFLIGTFLIRMVEHLRLKERSRTAEARRAFGT